MAKVFVSYSRKDIEFTKQYNVKLQEREFNFLNIDNNKYPPI